ncbi:divalent-cation tolerance protein CutA [Aliikangiella sp. IMCC44653]
MKSQQQDLKQADSQVYLCLSTAPNIDVAKTIAEELLQQNLVACVTMLDGVTSMYRWQGKVECEQEVQLLLKTHEAKLDALKGSLAKLHPYDVPEFIALKVADGLPDYLNWVNQTLTTSK